MPPILQVDKSGVMPWHVSVDHVLWLHVPSGKPSFWKVTYARPVPNRTN